MCMRNTNLKAFVWQSDPCLWGEQVIQNRGHAQVAPPHRLPGPSEIVACSATAAVERVMPH